MNSMPLVLVCQMRIALCAIEPPIWRRIQVPAGLTLRQLHGVLQAVMGWGNLHLHSFTIGKQVYGPPDPYGESTYLGEGRAHVGELFVHTGRKFTYLYDFGDGWKHVGRVEGWVQANPQLHYPLCLEGARACPPEDCGSYPGYAKALEMLQQPDNPEHTDLRQWLTELYPRGYDPEAFDLVAINRRLGRFGRKGAPHAQSALPN